MPARLLLDNDFILKISTLDLIEEFTSLPFVRDSELRHIKALHFMIAKGKFGDYPPEGLQRAQSWISTFPYVEAVDPVFHDRIPLTPGIDTGEKLLLADLLQHVESSVFTGDKRCITAIGGFSAELREAFSGRILCLEAAVRAIVARYDFDRVAGASVTGVVRLPFVMYHIRIDNKRSARKESTRCLP